MCTTATAAIGTVVGSSSEFMYCPRFCQMLRSRYPSICQVFMSSIRSRTVYLLSNGIRCLQISSTFKNVSRSEKFHFGDSFMFHATQRSQMGVGARLIPTWYLTISGTQSTIWYPSHSLVSHLLSGIPHTT